MTRATPYNWPRTIAVLCAAAILIAMAAVACAQEPGCQYREPPAGAILLSFNVDQYGNYDPYNNQTPNSYWNHSVTADGSGNIIESQTPPYGNGVQIIPFAVYMARPYRVAAMYPRDPDLGIRAAYVTRGFVGQPYRRHSSFAPNIIPDIVPRLLHGTSAGKNCVEVCMEGYAVARGQKIWGVHTPDDIARRQDLFAGPYWLQPPQQSQPPQVPPQPVEVP